MDRSNQKPEPVKLVLNFTGKAHQVSVSDDDRSLKPGFIADVWNAVCEASTQELEQINKALDEAGKSKREKTRGRLLHAPKHDRMPICESVEVVVKSFVDSDIGKAKICRFNRRKITRTDVEAVAGVTVKKAPVSSAKWVNRSVHFGNIPAREKDEHRDWV